MADAVLVLAHAESASHMWATPPASQEWFERQVATAIAAIPSRKLIISVGAYALDEAHYGDRRFVPVQHAWDLINDQDGTLGFDTRSLNSRATLHATPGRGPSLWILDAATGFNHTRAAMAANVGGVALYELGSEDPGVWTFFARGAIPDAESIARLETVRLGPGGLRYARGALLGLKSTEPGSRSLTFDAKRGLISDQRFSAFPGAGRIEQFHPVEDKTIAITFDDGPDANYSTAILDILAEKGVRATFYIVGRNALVAPDVLRRMYRDGHDIGNHSFSHAVLDSAGPLRLEADLNAAHSVVELLLGVRMRLLRLPYVAAHLPATPLLGCRTRAAGRDKGDLRGVGQAGADRNRGGVATERHVTISRHFVSRQWGLK